jgi:hypothetical protein
MFSITLKRSVATLGVVAGLLAAAVPAGAQGGGADFTRLADGPQGVLITNGAADDQMSFYIQQGQVPQQDRVITMLD